MNQQDGNSCHSAQFSVYYEGEKRIPVDLKALIKHPHTVWEANVEFKKIIRFPIHETEGNENEDMVLPTGAVMEEQISVNQKISLEQHIGYDLSTPFGMTHVRPLFLNLSRYLDGATERKRV